MTFKTVDKTETKKLHQAAFLKHFTEYPVYYNVSQKNNSEIVRLIDEIRHDNNHAFEQFIEQYKRLVYHIVFRMITDRTDCEDLCQDIFLKIFQNISGFRFESKISTWIAKIAHNQCINYLKKKKVGLIDDFTSGEILAGCIDTEDISQDIFLQNKDITERLRVMIDQLPVHFRTVLTLYHLEDMHYNEIADIMELPVGTVKSYLFRARKYLRKKLETKYRKEEIWIEST